MQTAFLEYSIQNDFNLLQIKMILTSLSTKSCIVGGAVRDSLIGKVPNDYDFVTDTPYDDLIVAFTEANWNVSEEGKQFLVLIVSKNGTEYEIANFRKDGTYVDGRRPDSVSIGNIEDDAKRRDFTINALYYRLSDCELLDPLEQGKSDLDNGLLRFVGKAKDRIKEDKLRVFRFYRFLNKLKPYGFKPLKRELRNVRELFNDAYISTNAERVRNELEKMVGL